ncbi:MAG: hypothetical protein WCN98_16670, partial [Verrucomicrobiaceae bacterium]
MGGGSTTQQTDSKTVNKPPKWFNDAAIKSLKVADEINQAGYVPYMGNQVAAFTPMQQSAMQSASDWASAANGTANVDAMAGMPQAKVDGSGIAGYESATGMMRNLELMKERFPKQYDQLSRFGGDLLSDPSRPPSDIKDSPWAVGDTAKKAWDAQNAPQSGGSGGSPYSLQQLVQQGLTSGGPMGAVMGFAGKPYMTTPGPGGPWQKTSAFQQLYNQDILNGLIPG